MESIIDFEREESRSMAREVWDREVDFDRPRCPDVMGRDIGPAPTFDPEVDPF